MTVIDAIGGGTGTGPYTPLWSALRAAPDRAGCRAGALRTVAPGATLRRIAPMLRTAGITRLADLTGLDYAGVPVYQAVRPNSRNLSVSQGKGVTRAQAKVSALMESLESFHAERIDQPRAVATVAAMTPELPYDPGRLLRPTSRPLAAGVELEWIRGTDLASGRPTWLPTQACELDAVVGDRLARLHFVASSNGLASGNTATEAVLHALCELVERDAAWRCRQWRWAAGHSLAPASVTSAPARRLLDHYAVLGLRPHVHVATSPTGMPCFEAFLRGADFPGSLFYGAGCHPRRSVALLRALTEAAQSRVTYIAGARDDLARRVYAGGAGSGPEPADEDVAGSVAYRDVPQLAVSDLRSAAEETTRRVREVCGQPPVAVDASRADFRLPVVKVVAPGLEARRHGDLEG